MNSKNPMRLWGEIKDNYSGWYYQDFIRADELKKVLEGDLGRLTDKDGRIDVLAVAGLGDYLDDYAFVMEGNLIELKEVYEGDAVRTVALVEWELVIGTETYKHSAAFDRVAMADLHNRDRLHPLMFDRRIAIEALKEVPEVPERTVKTYAERQRAWAKEAERVTGGLRYVRVKLDPLYTDAEDFPDIDAWYNDNSIIKPDLDTGRRLKVVCVVDNQSEAFISLDDGQGTRYRVPYMCVDPVTYGDVDLSSTRVRRTLMGTHVRYVPEEPSVNEEHVGTIVGYRCLDLDEGVYEMNVSGLEVWFDARGVADRLVNLSDGLPFGKMKVHPFDVDEYGDIVKEVSDGTSTR